MYVFYLVLIVRVIGSIIFLERGFKIFEKFLEILIGFIYIINIRILIKMFLNVLLFVVNSCKVKCVIVYGCFYLILVIGI